MGDFSWHDAYYSELQNLYALLVVPAAFLAWRLAAPSDTKRAEVPAAARFVAGLTLFFAIETMIDPISTGPIFDDHTKPQSSIGLAQEIGSTLVLLPFALHVVV